MRREEPWGRGIFTAQKDSPLLHDMNTEWKPVYEEAHLFEGRDRKTGALLRTGTQVDPRFGSNALCVRSRRAMPVHMPGNRSSTMSWPP